MIGDDLGYRIAEFLESFFGDEYETPFVSIVFRYFEKFAIVILLEIQKKRLVPCNDFPGKQCLFTHICHLSPPCPVIRGFL